MHYQVTSKLYFFIQQVSALGSIYMLLQDDKRSNIYSVPIACYGISTCNIEGAVVLRNAEKSRIRYIDNTAGDLSIYNCS